MSFAFRSKILACFFFGEFVVFKMKIAEKVSQLNNKRNWQYIKSSIKSLKQ